MHYSKQRELIHKNLMRNPVHPTADAVYLLVRQELPSVSLGTVYRNLNQLAAQGLIQKLSIPGVPDHFDGRIEKHCHLLCTLCAGVVDLPPISLCKVQEELAQTAVGVVVSEIQLHVTGICQKCNKDSKK